MRYKINVTDLTETQQKQEESRVVLVLTTSFLPQFRLKFKLTHHVEFLILRQKFLFFFQF